MEGRWLPGWLQGARSLRRRERHGAPADVGAETLPTAPPDSVAIPKGYSPKNVGNDASARPWEALEGASTDTSANTSTDDLPDDFDADAFLQASKTHFVNLQSAWDSGDVPVLRAMMTGAMLAEVQTQLAERERAGAVKNLTEVVMLEAQLLSVEDAGDDYLASVEFSGLVREDPSVGPNPFREVWNILRAKSGDGGWLVSGVQALR